MLSVALYREIGLLSNCTDFFFFSNFEVFMSSIKIYIYICWGTAVAQFLRCCTTNRKVTGSIPTVVSGFFIDIKSFRSHYGPGVDSASNRNEYQEYFLRVKVANA